MRTATNFRKMMACRYSTILPLMVMLMACPTAYAQPRGVQGSTTGKAQFQPKATDATKLYVEPQSEKIDLPKPKMEYGVVPSIAPTSPQPTKLASPSLKLKDEPLENHWLKAGFGNYGDAVAEYAYSSDRMKNDQWSAFAQYHTGNGPVDRSRFSDATMRAQGKKIFGDFKLEGGVQAGQQVRRLFGEAPWLQFSDDSNKRVWTNFGAKALVSNEVKKDTGLYFTGGLAFDRMAHNTGFGENQLDVQVHLYEALAIGKVSASVDFTYWGREVRKSIIDNNTSIFRMRLGYEKNFQKLHLDAGLKLQNATDTHGFNIYPDVRLRYPLVEKKLIVEGELTGGIQSVSYHTIAQENLWYLGEQPLTNTNQRLILGAGAFGTPAEGFSYGVWIKNEVNSFMAFYKNDTLDPRTFVLAYDSGNVNVLHFSMKANYKVGESLELGARLNTYRFGLSQLKAAYHRPTIEAALSGRYSVNKKIHFQLEGIYSGSRTANEIEKGVDVELPGYVDLNLGIEYELTNVKHTRLFLMGKNLVGQQYQNFQYYANRGVQVQGGAIFTF